MTNLFEMQCPTCGADDQIDILATVWLRLTDNGTDADLAENGDQEFGPDSMAHCHACDHTGTVAQLSPDE